MNLPAKSITDNYGGILHSSVIVNDLEKSLNFYQDVLGLTLDNSRPDLGYPGAWLWIGKQQIHLLRLNNPDPTRNRPQHVGRDRHTAISVNNLNLIIETLKKLDIPYTTSKSGRRALFCRDPDGNGLEFIEKS